MEINISHIIIIVIGIIGFVLSKHIRNKKKKSADQPFVCPLNFDCHTVVTSKYSKFLGVPLDIWGMLYYGFIVASYVSFFIKPELRADMFIYFVMAISLVAFIISLYLTFVQAFRLKEWCSWCLFSASLCTLIFVIASLGVFGTVNNIIVI